MLLLVSLVKSSNRSSMLTTWLDLCWIINPCIICSIKYTINDVTSICKITKSSIRINRKTTSLSIWTSFKETVFNTCYTNLGWIMYIRLVGASVSLLSVLLFIRVKTLDLSETSFKKHSRVKFKYQMRKLYSSKRIINIWSWSIWTLTGSDY